MILYTAITAKKDRIVPYNLDHENHLFTDDLDIPRDDFYEGWYTHKIDSAESNNCRRAKIYKICPHLFFSKDTMWIDGNIHMKVDAETLFNKQLGDGEYDMAIMPHLQRGTVYEEAQECIGGKFDTEDLISKQVQRYKDEGFDGSRLADCAMILRRNTPKVTEFNNIWWSEITRGSKRDQISFPYAVWKSGVKVKFFDREGQRENNNIYEMGGHNW